MLQLNLTIPTLLSQNQSMSLGLSDYPISNSPFSRTFIEGSKLRGGGGGGGGGGGAGGS